MKNTCENCGNYTIFYTKIGIRYFQDRCGRCWINKTITGRNKTCDKWETKPVCKDPEREDIIKAYDAVIKSLSIIKKQLTEE